MKNWMNKAVEPLKQYRSLNVMGVYTVFYLLSFFCLEQRRTVIHEINFGIDAYIPFCEFFVIPYLMWFGYVAAAVCYLCVKDKEEGDRLVGFLMAGMTTFIIVSALFPNGHHLRPAVFPRNNIFTKMVAMLYSIDTPTNVLPSIHAYNSAAVMIAVCRSSLFRDRRRLKAFMLVLGVSIIMSTVLIKQHSMLDVMLAVILAGMMYPVCYRRAGVKEKRTARYWRNKA